MSFKHSLETIYRGFESLRLRQKIRPTKGFAFCGFSLSFSELYSILYEQMDNRPKKGKKTDKP